MEKKWYDYYTAPNYVITATDIKNVSDKRLKEIDRIAREDVQKRKEIRDKSYFANKSEYVFYLNSLADFAFEEYANVKFSPVDD